MTEEAKDNPDRLFIEQAITKGQFGVEGVAIETNAFFRGMRTRLVGGSPSKVEIAFTIGVDAIQGNGVVGGGALASMLDCAMATATLSALKQGSTCATINLTVNMLGPGAPGEFRAVAEVDRLGRRVAFASAKLFDARAKLVATATCALALIEL